jgi:hypothetical protein
MEFMGFGGHESHPVGLHPFPNAGATHNPPHILPMQAPPEPSEPPVACAPPVAIPPDAVYPPVAV